MRSERQRVVALGNAVILRGKTPKNLPSIIAGDSSCSFGMTFACHAEVLGTEESHPQAYVMLSVAKHLLPSERTIATVSSKKEEIPHT